MFKVNLFILIILIPLRRCISIIYICNKCNKICILLHLATLHVSALVVGSKQAQQYVSRTHVFSQANMNECEKCNKAPNDVDANKYIFLKQ